MPRDRVKESIDMAETDEARPPEFSDDALALEFAKRHADDLRYIAQWGRWFHWDGARWKEEPTLLVFDLVRVICREAAEACDKPSLQSALCSAKTIYAIERLARTDRRIAATIEQWDVDPMLLNTPKGTIDLHTGELTPHRRTDYITKTTAVAPGGECPRWLAFLDQVFGGDKELISFVQRVVGYCLTGSIEEHAMFFGYGTGGNGKSTLIDTIAGIIGEYATAAAMEVFTESYSDRHPTELAALRGARLVTASETEKNRHWAEAKIKTLTGGGKVSARFMRQDLFEYTPAFKLVILGNHKPALRTVDEAIRRRMHLIPFTITIPPEERDPKLPEKLREEWPGILQWAIDGCLAWQREGLAPPEVVRAATAEYLASEDNIEQWIAEKCVRTPNSFAWVDELYQNWKRWAEDAGENPGSKKAFSQELEKRGFEKDRKGHGGKTGFHGIRCAIEYADETGSG